MKNPQSENNVLHISVRCAGFDLTRSSLYIVDDWSFEVWESKMPSFPEFIAAKAGEFAENDGAVTRFNSKEAIAEKADSEQAS